MLRKRRVLVAVTPMGYVHARRALHECFELVSAFSLAQAITSLRASDFDAILCSIHFDDSQMFALLREAQQRAPRVPFVCCRILHSELTAEVLAGTARVSELEGARAFIDYNELHRLRGFAEADRILREKMLALVPPDEASPLATAGSC